MNGVLDRQKREFNDRAQLAWNIANLGRAGANNFPALKSLQYHEKPKAQTPLEMAAAMRAWVNAQAKPGGK